jgi:hypothetical protein
LIPTTRTAPDGLSKRAPPRRQSERRNDEDEELENLEQGDELAKSNPEAENHDPLVDRIQFLEKSAFKADEGELIGKHPADVSSQILSLKFRAQNPLRAIREKCLDCCCGNAAEIRKCVAFDCALWPFRMRTNPFRKKRRLSAAQKRERAERLSIVGEAR